jgi:hypothetical protein
MRSLVYIFLLTLFVSENAYAYLDPGSGASIIQIIIAFIAAIGATISFYWGKFKLILSKLFKNKKKDKTNQS